MHRLLVHTVEELVAGIGTELSPVLVSEILLRYLRVIFSCLYSNHSELAHLWSSISILDVRPDSTSKESYQIYEGTNVYYTLFVSHCCTPNSQF